MRPILILLSEGKSRFFAVAEIADRLIQGGYTVTVASTRAVEVDLLNPAVSYVQLAPRAYFPAEDEAVTRLSVKSPYRVGDIATNALRFRERRRRGVENLNQEEFTKLLNTLRPRLVLVDAELYAYIFTLYREGIAFVPYYDWFYNFPLVGLPAPFAKGRPASTVELTEMWKSYYRRRMKAKWATRLKSGFNDRASVLFAYARACAFPTAWLREDAWPPKIQVDGPPTLRLVPRQLELAVDIPRHHHYVGAMLPRTTGSLRPALNSLIEAAKRGGRSVLYATFSTMYPPPARVLDRLIATVGNHPEWVLFVSFGGFEVGGDRNVPENVHLLSWVNQPALLREIAACIHQGGGRTLVECIAAGVPQLILCGNVNDQAGNTVRAVEAGVALEGTHWDTPAEVERDITNLLKSQSIYTAVRELANEINSAAEHEKLLRFIDEFVGRPELPNASSAST